MAPCFTATFNHAILKRCLDEIIATPCREEGQTMEEIEHDIRSKQASVIDLENPNFTAHFKAALKKGVSKGRYIKDGKYYRMAPTSHSMKVS